MAESEWLDTTILAECTLKPWSERIYRDALKQRDVATPEYAVKELKRGILQYYVWAHNILVERCSAQGLQARVNAVFRQRYRQAAVNHVFANLWDGSETLGGLVETYGAEAGLDHVRGLQLKAFFADRIFDAWNERYQLGPRTLPLACYVDVAPQYHRTGTIETPQKACAADCCLAALLAERATDTKLARRANSEIDPQRDEHRKRSKALKRAAKGRSLDDRSCRDLGDAVFAVFAPHTVLTTNLRDIGPLCAALGKTAVDPSEV